MATVVMASFSIGVSAEHTCPPHEIVTDTHDITQNLGSYRYIFAYDNGTPIYKYGGTHYVIIHAYTKHCRYCSYVQSTGNTGHSDRYTPYTPA